MKFYNQKEFIEFCKKEGIGDALTAKIYTLIYEKDLYNEDKGNK